MQEFKNKKIAIIHDSMVAFGGGESVLEILYQMFPEADYFTSYIDYLIIKKSKLPEHIASSWLQGISLIEKYPRIIQLLAPFIWGSFNLNRYDIIISHSGFYMSDLVNQKILPSQFSVCYMITPPKNIYYRDHQRILDRILNKNYYSFIKRKDKISVNKTSMILAVSKEVQRRIKNTYQKGSLLLYPPVDLPDKRADINSERDYFCYAGRLSKEKNLELLVRSFNINKLPLLIIGKGKEKKSLMSLSGKNIRFVGFKRKNEMFKLLSKTIAFIHVAPEDDFPLTPIQALGCGIPVITYKNGGTKEAVINGKTGLTFSKLTVDSLNNAVKRSLKMNFDPELCRQKAEEYSVKRFKKQFFNYLSYGYRKFQSS